MLRGIVSLFRIKPHNYKPFYPFDIQYFIKSSSKYSEIFSIMYCIVLFLFHIFAMDIIRHNHFMKQNDHEKNDHH